MIEELLISNVRVFEGPEEWRIPLSPLTTFCGTNSAGKSTVLKVLLLLCQTNTDADVTGRAGQIRLSGGLVDFGSYQAFVSHNKIDQDVMVGLKIRNTVEFRHIRALLKSDEKVAESKTASSPAPDESVGYTLTVRFKCGLRDFKSEPTASVPRRRVGPQRVFIKEASYNFESVLDAALTWKVVLDPESNRYHILVPVDFLTVWASQAYQFLENSRESDEQMARVEVVMRGALPIGVWAQSISKKKATPVSPGDFAYFPLPPLLTECSRDLDYELDHVHYLGPLRSPARRYYMTNLDLDPKMDPAGEFLPYVLRDQRDQVISCVLPQGKSVQQTRLQDALDAWMLYLRTGQTPTTETEQDLSEIDVSTMKEVLLEFTIKTFGGELHALADSGFGYSQVLPILVRGLIAQMGSTIIIEQPEVHLNPAIQVRLAEFLAKLSMTGKRVLIETHSEHIVNAIRVLAAEDPENRLAGNCKIVYVNTESGKPRLDQLEIQANGTIPKWPRQFFGEALSLSSRLLRAQDKKKASPRG